MGMSSIEAIKLSQLGEYREKLDVHSMRIPHYFLTFFNQTKSLALAYDEVRESLALAVNREKLVQEALDGRGTSVHFSFFPGMPGSNDEAFPNTPDIERAKEILEENGWSVGEDGIRSKDDVRLEFDLITVDWPEFMYTADLLREQWKEIGIQANVKVVTVFDLGQNYIRPREYDALLFAHATSVHPDLFSYWHSSQKNDPGLNLALFQDDNADELLEKAREAVDQNERVDLYRKFQEIFVSENPAVYLFSPDYLYPVHERVRGISVEQIANPADRFSHVSQWYVKTKRVFK
jgi:peptide/nickel transport system substrate-binding protein